MSGKGEVAPYKRQNSMMKLRKFLRVSPRKHCSRNKEFLSAVTIFPHCVTRSVTDARNLVQLCDADCKIIESLVNLVFLPITLDIIDSLEVSITDQEDHLLNLRNEKLMSRFHIREAR